VSTGGENNTLKLLEDIEEFSRNGPLPCTEAPKPELHRETLAFPDLNKAPVASKPVVGAGHFIPLAPTSKPGGAGGEAAAANSLLARLKQQANTLQQDAGQREAQQELRAQLLSASLGAAFHYLDDLVKQLNIIKPAIPKEFIFPGNIPFANMSWVAGNADFRMVPSATDDRRYENLSVRYRIASGQKISLARETTAIEPFRKTLHDYGIAFELEEKLNDRNIAESARFSFPCEIKAGFLIKADYEAGDLVLRTRNIDRFGMMEFRLRAEDLHQETLDELTHLIMGEKSRFLQMYRRSA
jgi:hypothetical protein